MSEERWSWDAVGPADRLALIDAFAIRDRTDKVLAEPNPRTRLCRLIALCKVAMVEGCTSERIALVNALRTQSVVPIDSGDDILKLDMLAGCPE